MSYDQLFLSDHTVLQKEIIDRFHHFTHCGILLLIPNEIQVLYYMLLSIKATILLTNLMMASYMGDEYTNDKLNRVIKLNYSLFHTSVQHLKSPCNSVSINFNKDTCILVHPKCPQVVTLIGTNRFT